MRDLLQKDRRRKKMKNGERVWHGVLQKKVKETALKKYNRKLSSDLILNSLLKQNGS